MSRERSAHFHKDKNSLRNQAQYHAYLQNAPIKHIQHPADRSSVITYLNKLLSYFLILFLSIPCILLLIIFLPISLLFRTLFRLICTYRCTNRPCSCQFLSSNDLFWFYETQNNQPNAAAIFILEGSINENSLKKLLLNRLVTANIRRGSNHKLYPRFSQLVVSSFAGIMWIDNPKFSINDHVKEIPRNIQTELDLEVYMNHLMSNELSRHKPLWEIHYKNRFNNSNDSIIIFLYHSCISDGISLIRILLKNVIDNRTAQLDIKPRYAGRRLPFDYIKVFLFGYLILFEKLFSNDSYNLLKVPIPCGQKNISWSTPFSLSSVNRMKLVTRTKMNDLLSTLVITCVNLYMEHHGIRNSPDMNCIVPFDLRKNKQHIRMGNYLAHVRVKIPINIEGNIPRLWAFHDCMKNVKYQSEYATMFLFTKLTYILFPLYIANKIIARVYNNVSFWLTTITTRNSTALATMSILNKDIRSYMCLSPSVGACTISFCVTTYSDEIRLAVIADSNIMPDVKFITKCFIEQLETVRDLLAHRRIPGEVRRITRPQRIMPAKKSISSISDTSDDLPIEEIQAKMTSLQQELLSLKSQFENVDGNDPNFETQRLIITAKLEELRKEFRELLIKLQERQCELSGMIPSDEEEEMDQDVRVRLRSASIASRISLRSNKEPLTTRIYQLEKEESSGHHHRNSFASSKMSLGAQSGSQVGFHRVDCATTCEDYYVDQRPSLSNTHRTSSSKTTVHIELWKPVNTKDNP
ncbi:unnamed protein product [Didymodactylos carnosus]|uniref:Diacylglycerol O-acyltransferase n=1 Tax=Didymodactylos carnosus TaxID=1234261 RepID=A0A813T9C9_9BILA|nr:unnamed protein product [Didymodactylos carnosus]CAF0805834.1 unnamed protein product [Didymodactylos carnosus]CAF3532105.1 unnamed protein product [Didymodactylos carnosus]CAF3591246.1 unnamed protein product [Didymodactylos carnosus]